MTRVDCGYPCFGQINLTPAYTEVADGDWHELAVPLSCFSTAGADFSNITVPFLMFTVGQWSLDLADIRWEPDYEANVTCGGDYQP